MSKELKKLQIEIDADVMKLLKEQKKLQRKPVYFIIEELVKEKYQSLSDRLKELGE
jgi:hypothetical protein|nr:MAG TPA: Transcriptional regulator [Caudoviricetes sp.]